MTNYNQIINTEVILKLIQNRFKVCARLHVPIIILCMNWYMCNAFVFRLSVKDIVYRMRENKSMQLFTLKNKLNLDYPNLKVIIKDK